MLRRLLAWFLVVFFLVLTMPAQAALVWSDRVQETTTTTGTSSYVLGGASTGYVAFSTIGDGNTAYYAVSDGGANWEVGLGTYSSSGNTLARTTILASSNAGSPVSWGAGTKTIWLDLPASAIAAFGNVTGPGSSTSGDVAIWSGTGGTALSDGGKALPSGAIVGTTDAQTLSAKTLASPAFTGTVAGGNTVPLGVIAQSGANTMLGNWTGSTANVAANSMPPCADSGGNHLNYVSGTGVTCGSSTGTVPIASGVTGLGTGVATALGVNVGSAGAPVVNGGALGTPSSGTATNLTGTASGLTAGTATAANGLKTATTTVAVSSATAPSAGQVLTATSSTGADWETPAGGGGLALVSSGTPTSGQATYVITGIPTSYVYLIIYVEDVGANASSTLSYTISDDGGATYNITTPTINASTTLYNSTVTLYKSNVTGKKQTLLLTGSPALSTFNAGGAVNAIKFTTTSTFNGTGSIEIYGAS